MLLLKHRKLLVLLESREHAHTSSTSSLFTLFRMTCSTCCNMLAGPYNPRGAIFHFHQLVTILLCQLSARSHSCLLRSPSRAGALLSSASSAFLPMYTATNYINSINHLDIHPSNRSRISGHQVSGARKVRAVECAITRFWEIIRRSFRNG